MKSHRYGSTSELHAYRRKWFVWTSRLLSDGYQWNVFNKFFRKDDILHINGIRKEWRNLLISESSYAATYSCNEERELAVLFGKTDEIIHVGLDGFHPTLHGRDGVCLTMQTHTFAPYSAKPIVSQACSTATMCARQIAALCKRLHKAAYVKSEIM